jgi:hypothetical protein
MLQRERFRMCEVPRRSVLLPRDGLADAITPDHASAVVSIAEFLRIRAGELQSGIRRSIKRNIFG